MILALSTDIPQKATLLGYTGAADEPIRENFARVLLSLFTLFNQKQDERGPMNVIKAGMDGILTQAQERIERIRAALQLGKTEPAELRANLLDIAGFGVIATQIFDGTWIGPNGEKPSLVVGNGPAVDTAPLLDAVRAYKAATDARIDDLERRVASMRDAVEGTLVGMIHLTTPPEPKVIQGTPDIGRPTGESPLA